MERGNGSGKREGRRGEELYFSAVYPFKHPHIRILPETNADNADAANNCCDTGH